MANGLMSMIAGGAPQGPQPQPQGPQMPMQLQPGARASQEDIDKGHELAGHFLETLMGLVSKPQGQLTKQDVFQSAANLLGKGLFTDPQSRSGLVAQLTQLPTDEMALRQALGKEIMQIASFKDALNQHAQLPQAPAAQPPMMGQ